MIWPMAYEGDARTGAMLQRSLFDGPEREAMAETHGQVSLERAPHGELRQTYAQPIARRSDPITSHQAAGDANRGVDTLRARCLSALRDAGEAGLTDFALADVVGSQQTSAGKRRGELVAAGPVVNSGRTRPAPSGSQAIVWVAV